MALFTGLIGKIGSPLGPQLKYLWSHLQSHGSQFYYSLKSAASQQKNKLHHFGSARGTRPNRIVLGIESGGSYLQSRSSSPLGYLPGPNTTFHWEKRQRTEDCLICWIDWIDRAAVLVYETVSVFESMVTTAC